MAARNRSNSDHTRLISKSIFVTNFPDNTSAKDLWEVCKGYGTVVDVFIPNRKSRSGKRFAFVRFIKVGNVDRLVENLCTLWIGRMHLHANVVRYDRPPISSSRPNVAPRPTVKSVSRPSANGASSFVSVLKGNPNTINHISTSPAMVLDDECLVERDLDNFVLGEVKDFSSINNLLILLSNEGFQHVRLVYLGGLWVMIELPSIETKTRFMKHVGVASWFSQLRTAQSDFVSRERIVWIDIEGVPLHAWSRPTFSKIGSRWGEVLELEDNKDDCFARKRICIKTKQEDNILEKFKIIVRGKIFVVRAKELFVWSPSFKGVNDAEFVSDDDSVNGEEEKNDDMSKKVNLEDESDIEGVSETVFGDQDDPLVQELNQNSLPNEKEISSDPFNLYNLINKRDKGEENTGLDSSLPFPPGFTPADQVKSDRKNSPLHSHSGGLNSRVLEESQPTKDQGSPKDNLNQRVGGSILEVIDDMIKVGQAMGFTMEGSLGSKAKKDWIKELNNKHKVNFLSIQETKSDHISDMDIKSLWGNSKFNYTISESVGNSGDILCVWDPSVFCKENHIISDNFIALYGSWVSKKGYRNTIELPDGNNAVPLRSDTIWLVQNGCSFHGLRSEDPNQHLKDFLKLVDSLDLDVANRESTHLRLFQSSLRDQASNWLERLPAGSISTWEDLTTSFLAQIFPLGRNSKLQNDILMFQQLQGESLSEAWTRFKDLLQKVPHHGIDLWHQVQIFYDHVNPATRLIINQSADDVLSTFDYRLIELENQVQHLMEAHLAPKLPVQVNKISSSCEICSGPHDTQYCMENPKQAFVDYASSHTTKREASGSLSNPTKIIMLTLIIRHGKVTQTLGLVSNFMASQDARLSKFKDDFKQQQNEMTNKIYTFLKAINDRMMGALLSDTVKNLKLNVNSTSLILSAHSYPMEDTQSSSHPLNSINAIKTCSKQTNDSHKDQPKVKTLTVNEIGTPKLKEPEQTLEDEFKDLHLNLLVLEVLAHAPMYNVILDKYVKSLELGKNGSAFIQGEMLEKIKDLILFTLPCRLGDYKPFDTLADLGSCMNLIPLYLFKKLKIGLLEVADHVFGLADGTKSYPDFMDYHLPREWQISRDAELNPFKDVLVFRKMVTFDEESPKVLMSFMWTILG
ncbi:RNA-directed DNA polymerase, eukaryota [Tanacetum coccineum]